MAGVQLRDENAQKDVVVIIIVHLKVKLLSLFRKGFKISRAIFQKPKYKKERP